MSSARQALARAYTNAYTHAYTHTHTHMVDLCGSVYARAGFFSSREKSSPQQILYKTIVQLLWLCGSWKTLNHIATHCNALRHTATCCNTWQLNNCFSWACSWPDAPQSLSLRCYFFVSLWAVSALSCALWQNLPNRDKVIWMLGLTVTIKLATHLHTPLRKTFCFFKIVCSMDVALITL